ncbi:pyridoxal-phosphate dependent enzyme [Pseudomonas amygdali]|uniref:pyridoxal-phosphate dependent enzyme n=1 Tax=Pseudomonas amygdali TaxID=47877 RepID=UPI000319B971|nr:pyridoxal-phosphate dependent enzyme [Pseudomonas amygdali]KWT12088.1 serine dehydratase [Pseudomonas amygdali pv. aesculi]KWT22202.1 serine dehydratase [Pseudomonas amygdali pv. aesculi]KWT23292.1 serine dehydratase [Pseudomonas amygdali pv. aesculi]KWT25562.1 serine dehydratase [Pseudomonas amygdali pv. aesculi]KWT36551.1 serine dehydratase [Pseudomonas amygdali pv. aesculi]
MPLHIHTPLIESRPMSAEANCTIRLKMDALQPCGSFKLRGVGHACENHHGNGAQKFVSSSGGNAGLAVAYAGRVLGVPVTVVVPETTTPRAKDLLALEGAEVIVHGSSWQEANQLAQSLRTANDAFIHPFDDPLLWTGHATLIDEVAQAGNKPDAVVLSVGGGGLLCGVIEGLHRNGWPDVPVIAVETLGAASFRAATVARQAVELDRISSIATSLGAKRVCDQAVQYLHSHPIESVVVSDTDALKACERFLLDHRVLVEPACGAALSLGYQGELLSRYGNVLMVVCGGATATLAQIQTWIGYQ